LDTFSVGVHSLATGQQADLAGTLQRLQERVGTIAANPQQNNQIVENLMLRMANAVKNEAQGKPRIVGG
jgi:hypothetical protein